MVFSHEVLEKACNEGKKNQQYLLNKFLSDFSAVCRTTPVKAKQDEVLHVGDITRIDFANSDEARFAAYNVTLSLVHSFLDTKGIDCTSPFTAVAASFNASRELKTLDRYVFCSSLANNHIILTIFTAVRPIIRTARESGLVFAYGAFAEKSVEASLSHRIALCLENGR